MNFREYNTDKNADGSVNIRGLEIFKLCKRDGVDYDEKWFGKAQELFSAEKQNEYLPPAFIGHDVSDGKETEAIGFLDNLKLVGKTVIADIVKVPETIFNGFRERKFPNRSVEILSNTGQIAGLAFLGKTRPFHKMPLMEFREKEEETIQLIFEEEGSLFDNIKSAVLEAFGMAKHKFNEETEMTTEEKTKLAAELKADLMAEFKEGEQDRFKKMFADEFEKKTGVTPEKFDQNREEQAKKVFAEKKKNVGELACKAGLAPAVVNGYIEPIMNMFEGDYGKTIKFAEGEADGDIFEVLSKFCESVAKRAQDGTLLVDFKERSKAPGGEGNPNFDFKSEYLAMNAGERVALDMKVTKFMQDNKIASYDEALVKFLESKK